MSVVNRRGFLKRVGAAAIGVPLVAAMPGGGQVTPEAPFVPESGYAISQMLAHGLISRESAIKAIGLENLE